LLSLTSERLCNITMCIIFSLRPAPLRLRFTRSTYLALFPSQDGQYLSSISFFSRPHNLSRSICNPPHNYVGRKENGDEPAHKLGLPPEWKMSAATFVLEIAVQLGSADR
jgi:hypothetical protein